MTVFGADLSRPTGSLGQRQKPKEAKSKKGNFLLCLDIHIVSRWHFQGPTGFRQYGREVDNQPRTTSLRGTTGPYKPKLPCTLLPGARFPKTNE